MNIAEIAEETREWGHHTLEPKERDAWYTAAFTIEHLLRENERLLMANHDLQMWYNSVSNAFIDLQSKKVGSLQKVLQQISEEGSGWGQSLALAALKEET
jgi:hypothetical protein